MAKPIAPTPTLPGEDAKRFIVVNFYERNGFIMLRQPKPNHEQAPMYFDLARLPQDNCK